MVYQSTSEKDTLEIGRALGARLHEGDVVALHGEPGAGKTVLARGIALALGVAGRVTSPTFTLIHEHEGNIPLYHMDAYRVGGPEEMAEAGFHEYLSDGGIYGPGVIVVEWPENMAALLPDHTRHVWIAHEPEEDPAVRLIEIIGEEPA